MAAPITNPFRPHLPMISERKVSLWFRLGRPFPGAHRVAVRVAGAAVLMVAAMTAWLTMRDAGAAALSRASLAQTGSSGPAAFLNDPPEIFFDPYSGSTVSTPALFLSLSWCDDTALSGGTRVIKLNGAVVTSSFSYDAGGFFNPCFDHPVGASSEGTLYLEEGVNVVQATICDGVNCTTTDATYTYTPPGEPAMTIQVTPDSQAVSKAAFGSNVQRFTITSLGTSSAAYSLSVVCAPPAATNCTPDKSSITLAGGGSGFVDVTYSTGASGTSGNIRVRAHKTADAHDQDEGTIRLAVTAGTPTTTRVSVAAAMAPGSPTRSACLSVAIVPDVAYECGDVRITHVVPSVRTRNTDRGLALVYNSRFATGTQTVAAEIVAPSGATPTRVTATLSVQRTSGSWVTEASGDWAGAAFSPGTPVRIALPWNDAGNGSRLAGYDLAVTLWDGATPRAAVHDTGRVALVDRSTPGLIRATGWAVAGVEMLRAPLGGAPSGTAPDLLWVGGDGSARRYRRVGTSSKWVADAYSHRPDTLEYQSANARWVRWERDSLRVIFNTAGNHTQTVNRHGAVTTFSYSGSPVRLDSIAVPNWNQAYVFAYPNSDTVRIHTPHPSAGLVRQVLLRLAANGNVSSIRDADSTLVEFTYGSGAAAHRVASRKNRVNKQVRFAYDSATASNLLVAAHLDSVAGTAWRTNTFIPAEAAGMGKGATQTTAAAVAAVSTLLNGPRPAAGGGDDTTRIWVDRFGAPTKVVNAIGDTATYTRGDARFPGLVTEMRAPNGQRSWAMYDARGNIVVSAQTNPFGNGKVVATTYQWHSTWNMATKITSPMGDFVEMAYDAATGNRLWQQDARGTTSRVSYTYNGASGAAARLLSQVSHPDSGVLTVAYDATRGNVSSTTSPLQYTTLHLRDRLGRDSVTKFALAPGDTLVQRFGYDSGDRLVAHISLGPALSYSLRSVSADTAPVLAESLHVAHTYDLEGRRLSTASSGSGGGQTNQSETFVLNVAGEVVKRTTTGGVEHTYARDKAGNVLAERFPGATDDVTSEYDWLNRPVKRVVPLRDYSQTTCAGHALGPLNTGANCYMVFPFFPNNGSGYRVARDSTLITYHVTGGVATVVNRNASVRRQYYPGGALKTDSSNTTGFSVTYDLNGRRTSLVRAGNTLAYGYHTFGPLRRITDPLGNRYVLAYNRSGSLDTMRVIPAGSQLTGVSESRKYDKEGRMTYRTRTSAQLGTLLIESLRYDRRSKVDSVYSSSAAQGGDATTFHYSALGTLLSSERTLLANGAYGIEEFRPDVLGSNEYTRSRALGSLDNQPYTTTFANAGYLLSKSYVSPQGILQDGQLVTDEIYQGVQSNGNVIRSGQVSERVLYEDEYGTPYVGHSRQTATQNYYGNDGRLMATQRYGWLPGGSRDGTWEEYRYDGLGRRVGITVRRDNSTLCTGSTWCETFTESVLWDGDQVLAETRGTELMYVHAGGIDAPLGTTNGRILNSNWRGLYESSVWPNGAGADMSLNTGSGTLVNWPAKQGAYYTPGPGEGTGAGMQPAYAWVGSLAINGQQSTGQLYRRNRHYDPLTGQFTQPDPIGLAGGLNLYGYAGGDPINFSDPFGLCPENETGRKCTFRDILKFSVSFGGQAGYTVQAGAVSSSLRAQVWRVGEITVGANVENPLTMSDAEASVTSTVTAFGQGGHVKFDFAAPHGEQLTALPESQVVGDEVGGRSVQRSRGTGKVGLKAGVGIMFGFEIDLRALKEVVMPKDK